MKAAVGPPAVTNTMQGKLSAAAVGGAKPPGAPTVKVGTWLGDKSGGKVAPLEVGAQPAMSGAAARLLAKTADQKRASYNSTVAKVNPPTPHPVALFPFLKQCELP